MISIPRIPGEDIHIDQAAVLRTRLNVAWLHYLERTRLKGAALHVLDGGEEQRLSANSDHRERREPSRSNATSMETRMAQYVASKPLYDMSRLIVSDATRQQLLVAASIIAMERQVFDEWGLRAIEPFPRSALNFHGAPGTGKTMAAHALASHLGVDLMQAGYAQIESMYHGEGPKNVVALFNAAERGKCLLLIDEADSLLSRRLTSVSQGSEQAINSMRSQLLVCLEAYRGVVVFATNLVENYDSAFETRVRSIEFVLPDRHCRRKIWQAHLPPQLPLAADVELDELADLDDLCGRDIRNTVVEAAIAAAVSGQVCVSRQELLAAVARVKAGRFSRGSKTSVHELTEEEQRAVEAVMRKKNAKLD